VKVPVYHAPDVKPVFVHPIPGYGGHLEVLSMSLPTVPTACGIERWA